MADQKQALGLTRKQQRIAEHKKALKQQRIAEHKLALKQQRIAEARAAKSPLNQFVLRASECEAKGDYPEAISIWRAAIERFPANASVRVRHALAAINVSDMATAERELLSAIELKDEPRPWWFGRLANIQVALGKRAAAIDSYRTALRLDPDQVIWCAALSELERRPNANEASAQYYDDVYRSSEEYAIAAEGSLYLPLWQRIVEIVSELGARSVLDVGCGPGQFAAFLLSRCDIIYTGFDFSGVAIERAHARQLPAEFHCDDIFASALFTRQFDTIICTEVLEHIERDLDALARFPSGKYALCSVPSYPAFGHVRFFSNTAAVKDRYGYRFIDPQVEAVTISGTRKIFLIHGRLTSD